MQNNNLVKSPDGWINNLAIKANMEQIKVVAIAIAEYWNSRVDSEVPFRML